MEPLEAWVVQGQRSVNRTTLWAHPVSTCKRAGQRTVILAQLCQAQLVITWSLEEEGQLQVVQRGSRDTKGVLWQKETY